MESGKPPIPALLATGAVHHHLIATGLRSDCSIVVETSTCFSTHHAANLIGYGAHAICPYLAYETCRQWRMSSRTQSLIKSGKVGGTRCCWGCCLGRCCCMLWRFLLLLLLWRRCFRRDCSGG